MGIIWDGCLLFSVMRMINNYIWFSWRSGSLESVYRHNIVAFYAQISNREKYSIPQIHDIGPALSGEDDRLVRDPIGRFCGEKTVKILFENIHQPCKKSSPSGEVKYECARIGWIEVKKIITGTAQADSLASHICGSIGTRPAKGYWGGCWCSCGCRPPCWGNVCRSRLGSWLWSVRYPFIYYVIDPETLLLTYIFS